MSSEAVIIYHVGLRQDGKKGHERGLLSASLHGAEIFKRALALLPSTALMKHSVEVCPRHQLPPPVPGYRSRSSCFLAKTDSARCFLPL